MPAILMPENTPKAMPPSLIGPDASGKYYPLEIAEHVVRHGAAGAITVSTDGVRALAYGVDYLAANLDQIADAYFTFRHKKPQTDPQAFLQELEQILLACGAMPITDTIDEDAT